MYRVLEVQIKEKKRVLAYEMFSSSFGEKGSLYWKLTQRVLRLANFEFTSIHTYFIYSRCKLDAQIETKNKKKKKDVSVKNSLKNGTIK